jgi:plastocyanin
MHATVLHLVPVLGAEKSKAPFYIVGGALVLWAFFLGLGLERLRPGFPINLGGQRLLIAITALLVVGTAASAVATSGVTAKESAKPPVTPAAPAAPEVPAATNLALAAINGQIKYDKQQLSAKPGKVAIDFDNPSPIPHNVTIAQGSKVLGATPTFTGATHKLTLTLAPGSYVFYCSVPGHREAGMQGTLTVG